MALIAKSPVFTDELGESLGTLEDHTCSEKEILVVFVCSS